MLQKRGDGDGNIVYSGIQIALQVLQALSQGLRSRVIAFGRAERGYPEECQEYERSIDAR